MPDRTSGVRGIEGWRLFIKFMHYFSLLDKLPRCSHCSSSCILNRKEKLLHAWRDVWRYDDEVLINVGMNIMKQINKLNPVENMKGGCTHKAHRTSVGWNKTRSRNVRTSNRQEQPFVVWRINGILLYRQVCRYLLRQLDRIVCFLVSVYIVERAWLRKIEFSEFVADFCCFGG